MESTPLSWQERILQSVPSGIDVHQLERFFAPKLAGVLRLELSPTERLEKMRQLLALRSGNELSSNRTRNPYPLPRS